MFWSAKQNLRNSVWKFCWNVSLSFSTTSFTSSLTLPELVSRLKLVKIHWSSRFLCLRLSSSVTARESLWITSLLISFDDVLINGLVSKIRAMTQKINKIMAACAKILFELRTFNILRGWGRRMCCGVNCWTWYLVQTGNLINKPENERTSQIQILEGVVEEWQQKLHETHLWNTDDIF